MGLTIDFGLGWKYAPNLITVDLLRQDGSAQSVPYVLKRASDLRDVQQEPAVFEEETAAFHLWQDHLAGAVPDKGDRIALSDGSVWRVVSRQTQNHARKFRLVAFREHNR